MKKINVSAQQDEAFVFACVNGHLDVAKWLLLVGKKKIKFHVDDHYAFWGACENGHLEVAMWFYDTFPVGHITLDKGFCVAYENGHLDVVKWLYSVDPKLLVTICLHDLVSKNSEVTKWHEEIKNKT